jgi:Tfp pilus assembly protein PilN
VVAEDGDFGDIAAAIEQGLRCQAVFADPYARVEGPPEFNGGAAVCVAEGLALRVLAQEKTAGTNFLEAETAGTKPGLDLKKELVFCSVLAVVIAAVCLAGLYIRLFYLEREYEWLTGEIKGLFQRTVPEEKNIVNPVVQLEQKLKSLQADSALSGFVAGSSVGPLEVLRAITATAPSEASITINSMLITGSSLRLTGNSQSFESVYAWRQRLQGASQFSAAEVRDIARSSEGEPVNFTMLMSLAKE